MPCTLPQALIDGVKEFHGHSCPGLAIGLRAAELAKRRFAETPAADLVALSETDMCGVDAIQFVTGCTIGKGNLVLKDVGKMAFSFFDRKSGQGFRALLRPSVRQDIEAEMGPLMRKIAANEAHEDDRKRAADLRAKLEKRYMDLPLEEMFEITERETGAPRPARILASLVCESCGESTMESRTRRFDGKVLCIPCFQEQERKI